MWEMQDEFESKVKEHFNHMMSDAAEGATTKAQRQEQACANRTVLQIDAKAEPPTRSILEMSADKARGFLLKPVSYCSIDIPDYIDFTQVLAETAQVLDSSKLSSMQKHSPRDESSVNYTLLANKDGRHAWRPFQIIHPASYVSLVQTLTAADVWAAVTDGFAAFSDLPRIDCLSIPVESQTKRSDKAEQVTQWWQGIEQRSIELSLEYSYVLHADISDCYGSIYTHSIPWALHTRSIAKVKRKQSDLPGNEIDGAIQDMREGQTNGIPQGSVVMDFIAEMVLGYADKLLAERLGTGEVTDYHILRYRDDYRVFVNSPEVGELILRTLTEVLIDLGLKLNGSKTSQAQPVVRASLKPDKWAWLLHKQRDFNLQKHMLGIHAHGTEFPNAGSLLIAMSAFHKQLMRANKVRAPLPMIGIALDIAIHSPRVFPACAAVISRLLQELDSDRERRDVLQKILTRIRTLPNVGTMEVWLQRISHPIQAELSYTEQICEIVRTPGGSLWNNDWISSKPLLTALGHDIIDRDALDKLSEVVQPDEIDLFSYE
jgi:RNA-directed DNA polymerase